MFDIELSPDAFNPRILYVFSLNLKPGIQYPYHHHADFTELSCVISGSATYKINDTLRRVKKGDVLIGSPSIYHQQILAPGESMTELYIGFNNLNIKSFTPETSKTDLSTPIIRTKRYRSEFIKCCEEINVENNKKEPGYNLILKPLVMKLMVVLLKENYFGESSSQGSQLNFDSYDKAGMVHMIASYLEDNYMKDISLDKISKNMYLSPVYISKIFKEETGDSPINHLIKIRLAKAKEMMLTGGKSIKSVAESVGYNDAYYFSKLFKKYYGVPPSKCQK